jgi:hypothetical protein
MRLVTGSVAAFAVAFLLPAMPFAQGPAPARGGAAGDVSRSVAGGGISVPGWMGRIDQAEAGRGSTLNDAKLSQDGNALHVMTGPATTYWTPGDKASGDYTVKATFREPKYMNLNTHPHPYGIFIGGNDLGTPQQSYLYCAAYGNGMFIVRGFGPSADGTRDSTFQMNGGRGDANAAVHKAAGVGEPVEQEIAMSVKGGKVECAINGTTVATYDKAAVVAPDKLKSTDGIYGIRFAHNTEGLVSGLSMTKN